MFIRGILRYLRCDGFCFSDLLGLPEDLPLDLPFGEETHGHVELVSSSEDGIVESISEDDDSSVVFDSEVAADDVPYCAVPTSVGTGVVLPDPLSPCSFNDSNRALYF